MEQPVILLVAAAWYFAASRALFIPWYADTRKHIKLQGYPHLSIPFVALYSDTLTPPGALSQNTGLIGIPTTTHVLVVVTPFHCHNWWCYGFTIITHAAINILARTHSKSETQSCSKVWTFFYHHQRYHEASSSPIFLQRQRTTTYLQYYYWLCFITT